ncbi:M6 metalloprotease [Byssothecium circinans]|uniref:M6 metalloprotease n=1 Tax=Byssothecium circinans TaxID=147558 RepID=A0A6A5TA42_9PLEO|nr:M6 metalloprotease [Byssothecium circinans]
MPSATTLLVAALALLSNVNAQSNVPNACRPRTWGKEKYAPSIGALRAALIFIDFPDFPANTTVAENLAKIGTRPIDLFKQMSYGKLDLEFVPVLDKFYRMPSASSSYDYHRNLTTEQHLKYINDALKAVGTSVSFNGIDVLYLLPPMYANEISFSPTTTVAVRAADGTRLGATVTFGQDLYFRWGSKTVNHETGHTMGLPDLYPYAGGATTQWVGGYDLMGLISAQSPDYIAWHKWQLGWIEDKQIDCVTSAGITRHRISPIEVAGGGSKAVVIPTSKTAYVVAEVRSTQGVDNEACGTGVLLYTVDTAIPGGSGPVRVIDTKPNSGGCKPDNGGELNDAPLASGSTYDTGLGVVVTVVGQEGAAYLVEIERSG